MYNVSINQTNTALSTTQCKLTESCAHFAPVAGRKNTERLRLSFSLAR